MSDCKRPKCPEPNPCHKCHHEPKPCDRCHGEPANYKVMGCPPKAIQINNPCCPVLFHRVDIPAIVGDDTTYPPENGLYKNVLLVYEATGNVYMYSSDGIPTKLTSNIDELEKMIEEETENRIGADEVLQGNIDTVAEDLEEFKNSPDVVDIVGTYADLEVYDTSDLGDKDIVRVLEDETHDNESSYYRWNKTAETWTFIGATGPYYTESEVDNLLSDKADKSTTYTKTEVDTALAGKQNTLTAGANVQINGNVISATDTIYVLPPATAQILGGVKIGEGISVASDGTISVDFNSIADADWSALWS